MTRYVSWKPTSNRHIVEAEDEDGELEGHLLGLNLQVLSQQSWKIPSPIFIR